MTTTKRYTVYNRGHGVDVMLTDSEYDKFRFGKAPGGCMNAGRFEFSDTTALAKVTERFAKRSKFGVLTPG